MRRDFFNDTGSEPGIYLTDCGTDDGGAPDLPPSGGAAYRILCVTDGEGAVEEGGREYAARKGSVFLFRPGSGAALSSAGSGKPLSLCWMTFAGSDAEYYLQEAGTAASLSVKGADPDAFSDAVAKCLDHCDAERGSASRARITAYLLEGVASLKGRRSAKVRMRASEQADRAADFIENNYMHGITAGDVAAKLGIDRTHFFRIFKAKTGISPEQYIMKLRMKAAKDLLSSGTNTVTEIASLVGVSDVYYFSKLFKRTEGISPTEYRKNFNKDN